MGIIVHSFGKCGSSSIYQTLLTNGFMATHVHYLMRPPEDQNINALDMIRRGMHTHIIVPIREPVRRNMSGFWMNCPHRDHVTWADFLKRYDHEIPHRWFDLELKGYWGLDVYEQPFDKRRGWHLYAHNGLRFLVIRTKDLTLGWADAFMALTGADAPKLQLWKKTTAPGYLEWIKSKPPDEYVKRMRDTRFYKHFYE